jgi:hypothetical protein
MFKPVQFGQSTLVIQGSRYQSTVEQAVQFSKPMHGPHVTVGPVTKDGDILSVTIKGPAAGEVTPDKTDYNYDPERESISGLVTMLKIAGVPLHTVTLTSDDRPDLSGTFIRDFRDKF